MVNLSQELGGHVHYYSEGMLDSDNPEVRNEPLRRVRYDFQQLSNNPVIRNGYYWATDTHSDWNEWTNLLVELTRKASTIVEEELAKR